MNRIVTVIALAGLLLLSSCLDRITGSGVMAYREFNYDDFTAIIIEDACNATVTEGDEFKVEIEIDDNLVSYTSIYQHGNTLHIGLEDDKSYSNINFRATITIPSLQRLRAEDASRVTLSRQDPLQPLHLEAKDASGIKGEVDASSLTLHIEDASNITLSGTVPTVTLNCDDASSARLQTMTTTDMSVAISDASDVNVAVSGTLSGNVSDASTLTYYGDPATLSVHTSDASHLKKGN